MQKQKNKSIAPQPAPIYALLGVLIAVLAVGGLDLPGVSASDFYKEGIAEVGFSGLLLYWLYRNRALPKIILTISTTRLFFAALLVLASASALWAVNIEFFVSKYLLWLGVAAIFLLTLTLPSSVATHIVLARGLVLAATYVAIIGLVQVGLFGLPTIEIYSQVVPPAATFGNKNMAVQVIVLIFPLGCFLLTVDQHKPLSRLYPLMLALMLAYVLHTQTRAAWLSLALQGVLILLAVILFLWRDKEAFSRARCLRQGNPWLSILLAIVLLLLLVNLSAQGWSPFGNVFSATVTNIVEAVQSYGDPVRQAHRYVIWEAALTMIANKPWFGAGMGSFFYNLITESERYGAYVELRAHNDVLELGVELGIIGWVLLLGVVLGLLSALYKLITRGQMQHRLFYLAIAIALAGSALNMQFSFPYQMPAPLMLFGLYAALIVKAGDRYATIKTIALSLKPLHWRIGQGVVGGVVVFAMVTNIIWLGAIYSMTDNIKNARWRSPAMENTLVCHKTIVKTMYFIASLYSGFQKHEFSLGALDSFAQCVPDTWLYESAKGVNMIGLQRYDEAIAVLEKAKQHAPKIEYSAYVNQFVAYRRVNDRHGALQVYQQLSAQPLLATQPKILRALTQMGLQLKLPKQAEKFYRLYRQNYGNNPKFEAQVGPIFNQ